MSTAARVGLLAAILSATWLAGCGGDGEPLPGPSASSTPASVSGTLTFDKVPSVYKGSGDPRNGLDFAHVVMSPLRGVEVAVVDAADNSSKLATGTTDAHGAYSLAWTTTSTASQVKLIVYARTTSPKITVQDNTGGRAVYALASAAFPAANGTTKSLNVDSGWNAAAGRYDNRHAAPYAVLDTATQAARAFLAARPNIFFPDLLINWSKDNVPSGPQGGETQDQAYAAGRIGTSHWNGTELYILGKEDVDTDEFDDHVIAHEWGHYFESMLGRSDSPGGSHSAGDLKDARLAFGEGWGNGLSAIVWSPNSVYSDSSGVSEASGFGFDMEDNLSYDPNPGWFSESSVQSILYDLFDDSGSTESFDKVALGLGPIYDAMVGAQKTTGALTTLFSLVDALRKAVPAQAANIDALTAYHGVLGKPVADAWGTGETNSGGSADNLPVYHSFISGQATVRFAGGAGNSGNELGQNRYLHFTGNGASHRVAVSEPLGTDLDLAVLRSGQGVLYQTIAGGTGTTGSFSTASGADYVLVVTGYGSSASYAATVTLQ